MEKESFVAQSDGERLKRIILRVLIGGAALIGAATGAQISKALSEHFD